MISITFRDELIDGIKNPGKTFDFQNGQIVGLFGKNGSGKTTLLKTIMGMPPFNDDLTSRMIDGKPFSKKNLEDMVYITDGLFLYDDMNACDHGNFFAAFHKKFNMERFDKLIELFELDPYMPVKKYSKGQRSKLELALGFSKGAKYLLLDEPFIGNDPFMRNDFLKIMAGLLDEDSILIIATHYIEEIQNFIDRAIFMHERRIVRDVMMDEILESGSTLMDNAKEVFEVDEDRVANLFSEE